MTDKEIYRSLALKAQRVVGADRDPDRVPSKRALAVSRTDGLREVPFEKIQQRLDEASGDDPREHFQDLVQTLREDEYWSQSALVARLIARADELDALLTQADIATGRDWYVFDISSAIGDILEKMYRRLERESLDDGYVAAQYLMRELGERSDFELAALLAEEERYIADLRVPVDSDRASMADAPWDEARACLVAQLAYDLSTTASPGAIVEWFANPRDELDGLTPLEAINLHGSHDVEVMLRKLARLGRGQVAT